MSSLGVLSPNFAVLGNWKTSLSVMFQALRRIPFVTEDAFTFSPFDPQIDWSGMTATSPSITTASYIKLGKIFAYSLDFQATLAAPLANTVYVTIPFTTPIVTLTGTATPQQHNYATAFVGGNNEVGFCFALSGANRIGFRRSTEIAYLAGVTRWRANGFFEVQ